VLVNLLAGSTKEREKEAFGGEVDDGEARRWSSAQQDEGGGKEKRSCWRSEETWQGGEGSRESSRSCRLRLKEKGKEISQIAEGK
jgi:hypothetical protein